MAAVRKDKRERDRKLLAKRRTEFNRVLDKLGVRPAFERLPLQHRNRMYVFRMRRATVELAEPLRDVPSALELKEQLEVMLSHPIVEVPGRPGEKLSYQEVVGPLMMLYAGLGPLLPREGVTARVAEAIGWPCTDELFEVMARAEKQVENQLLWNGAYYSRPDVRVYAARVMRRDLVEAHGESYVAVTSEPPRRRVFVIDGAERPAYQMGVGIPAQGGVVWTQWDAARAGVPAGHPHLPVFVQSHVVQRILERMPGERSEHKTASMHMLLSASLFKANVVQRTGETMWISFDAFSGERLGYLLAEVVDGAVLVRTFQFLTMQGSPEAKRLYGRLGARRADFEHLRLDQLATFLETDLVDDPDMRNIFDECGCGHLLTCARSGRGSSPRGAEKRPNGSSRIWKLGSKTGPRRGAKSRAIFSDVGGIVWIVNQLGGAVGPIY